MDPKIAELIKPYSAYFTLESNGKVKCEINGHSFPQNKPEQIEAFINGAKFAKLKVRYDAENALSKYEPFITVSKNFPHMLYCSLTVQLIEKSLASVKRHMAGKRFQRAKARFVADQQELRAEPELSEFGVVLPGQRGAKAAAEGDDGSGSGEDDEMEEEEEEQGEDGGGRPAGKGKARQAKGGKPAADGPTKGKKDKKQKPAAAPGDSDDDDDDDDGPAFWVPPDEAKKFRRGRAALGAKGVHQGGDEEDEDSEGVSASDDEDGGDSDDSSDDDAMEMGDAGHSDDEAEEDEEEAEGGDMMVEDERPGPRGRGSEAGPSGAPAASGERKKAQHAAGKGQQRQQQHGVGNGHGARGMPFVQLPGQGGKKKKGKKGGQVEQPAAEPDDFDFDVDGGEGEGAEAPAAAKSSSFKATKAKKKNVARPSASKKARKA